MAFKNNPGCACCGDVLIWNLDNSIPCDVRRGERLALPSHPATEFVNPRNATDTNWNHLTFENFKATLRDEGIKVDEITRLDEWSGDIDNYKLILWPMPNRAPDCTLCPNKTDPDWWPRVQNEEWSGRIVLLFDSPYHHVALEEDWYDDVLDGIGITFQSDCSMLAEEDAQQTASQDFFQSSELTSNWPTANFGAITGARIGMTVTDPDQTHPLMAGVTRLYHMIFHEVNGGSAVATTTVNNASGEPIEREWIREVVLENQSRIVCGDTTHMTDHLMEAVIEDDNNKQFWRNLFRVPIQP